MANEQKIIQDVQKAVDGLASSFKALDDILSRNMSTQKELIANLDQIKKNLSGTQNIKEYVSLQKQMQTNQAALSKEQQAAIVLARQQEALRQQAIKTQQAAINAAKSEAIQDEKVRQAKIRTEAAEIRLNAQKQKAAQRSREASSAYNIESKRLLELTKRAKDAAVQYGINSKEARALRAEQQKLYKQIKQIDASLGQYSRNVGNYSSAFKGLRSILSAAGIVGGVQLLVQGFRAAFTISKEYEKQNAVLASVLGKTLDQTTKLQEESKRLGATTAFSATQVVELQTELARLGKSENEIIDMTEGIIDATIALGSETGETAALVGATLNAFQLEASESSRVADILTLATQRSALSFEKLNTALPIVSGAAKAAGVSLEETVAMLGQVADRGIDASTAATSLRNIFISLSNSGMTLEEALSEINKSQDKLTKANELFGQRAAVTALALAETTDKTKDLTSALESAGGTAKDVADTQLNTLDGQLKLLNSAWEGLILNINNSETALGKFSIGFVKFLTNAITQLANLDSQFELIFKKTENLSDQAVRYIIESGQALTNSGKEIGAVIDDLVEKYGKLPDAAKESLTLSSFIAQGLRTEGETIEGARRIADFYVNMLEERKTKQEDALISHNKINEAVKEETIAVTDLIEIQEELLKQAKEMPGTTEAEVTARNLRIKAIEREIQRLKSLGEIEQVDAVDISDITDTYQEVYDEIEVMDEEYLEKYLENEAKRVEATKDAEERIKELREENQKALYDLTTEFTNAIFEYRIEKYDDEIEANQEYYDNLLANEQLSEEQRSLLEAQRDAKENELRKKQEEEERKQFLFQQALKVGEVFMEMSKGIATATAMAPATFGASLAWIPLIKTNAAIQIATILAQSIPQFAKGTDNAPEGLAIVGEKGTELVVTPDKRAWLTDDKPQLTYLEKGSQVIPNHELVQAINSQSDQMIVENKDVHWSDDRLAKMMIQLIETQNRNSIDIVKAIKGNNKTKRDFREIDRMRTAALKDRLRG